eukprot:SAG31_NODE_1922_length_6916_cov_3.724219_6_plen_93_part_01
MYMYLGRVGMIDSEETEILYLQVHVLYVISVHSRALTDHTLVLVTGNSFDPTPAAPSSERDSTGASCLVFPPAPACLALLAAYGGAVRCDALG